MGKKNAPEGKKYSYMDTYGDLVTLLLCFFVLLFAMSSVDEAKYNAFVEALTNRFGSAPLNMSSVRDSSTPEEGEDFGEEAPTEGETVDPVEQLPAELREVVESVTEYIAEQGLEGEIQVEVGESGATFIRLSDNLLFAGDSSRLQPEAEAFLSYFGNSILEVEDQIYMVNVLGHTGSIPGSGTDDWMLGSERAGRVSSHLTRQVGFSPYKLEAKGYGRYYPIADNSTAEGLAKNRRVDIIIISNDTDNLLLALAEAARIYFPSDSTEFFEGAPEELPGAALTEIAVAEGEVDLANLTEEQMAELYGILQDSQ